MATWDDSQSIYISVNALILWTKITFVRWIKQEFKLINFISQLMVEMNTFVKKNGFPHRDLTIKTDAPTTWNQNIDWWMVVEHIKMTSSNPKQYILWRIK